MMRRHAVTAAVLLCFCGVAASQDRATANAVEAVLSDRGFLSGEDVFQLGRSNPYLQSYVAGVFDSGSLTGPDVRGYCVPKGVSAGQATEVAYQYLDLNPADRHLGAAHLVRMAFRLAWPCPPMVSVPTPTRRPSPTL